MKKPRLALALGLFAAFAAAAAFSLADPKPDAPSPGFPPDPPAIATTKQWIFEITYRDGKASVAQVKQALSKSPTATARMMGRFAVEFWVGKELVDRIRFDVPLLEAPSNGRRGLLSGPRFGQVTARLKVRLADSPRATYVAVVDRATGDVQRFLWPPDAEGRLSPMGAAPVSASADAGPPGDAGSPDVLVPEPLPRDAGADG